MQVLRQAIVLAVVGDVGAVATVENLEFRVFGEGFQMLSQMTGTFANPVNIGRCMDDLSPYSHYPVEDYRTVYNMLLLKKESMWTLLGFTSCNKYNVRFN